MNSFGRLSFLDEFNFSLLFYVPFYDHPPLNSVDFETFRVKYYKRGFFSDMKNIKKQLLS